MIEGAAILLAGILAGVGLDRLLGRWPRRKQPRAVEALCSCGHSIAFHDPKTGRCHASDPYRELGFREWADCTCRRYDGPEPLPSFYAPEIAPE